MQNNIPGWTIKADEFSPGVFRVTLTDKDGRRAEVVDNATDAAIDLAKDYAFDIEKKLKRPWNKFLYDFCLLNIGDRPISTKGYNDLAFGSWIVELNNQRLIYDGKDFWLIYQTRDNGEWSDKTIIKYDEIKYTNFIGLINKIKG